MSRPQNATIPIDIISHQPQPASPMCHMASTASGSSRSDNPTVGCGRAGRISPPPYNDGSNHRLGAVVPRSDTIGHEDLRERSAREALLFDDAVAALTRPSGP